MGLWWVVGGVCVHGKGALAALLASLTFVPSPRPGHGGNGDKENQMEACCPRCRLPERGHEAGPTPLTGGLRGLPNGTRTTDRQPVLGGRGHPAPKPWTDHLLRSPHTFYTPQVSPRARTQALFYFFLPHSAHPRTGFPSCPFAMSQQRQKTKAAPPTATAAPTAPATATALTLEGLPDFAYAAIAAFFTQQDNWTVSRAMRDHYGGALTSLVVTYKPDPPRVSGTRFPRWSSGSIACRTSRPPCSRRRRGRSRPWRNCAFSRMSVSGLQARLRHLQVLWLLVPAPLSACCIAAWSV